ncbi:hypothetical protein [Phenylobacterium sp.]|uniref:hypothetical protein n=1 Tax=Phenylobacterium sp. TaxID=1871053 RepID=UPI0035B34D67
MPSSATARLRFEKQFTGENINVWGERLNANFDLIDQAICGLATIALTGDVTLTSANYAEDQARYAMLKFTGGGPFLVTLPSVQKAYRIWNACSDTLTITTGAGTTAIIDADDIVDVMCDGSNVKSPGIAGVSLKAYIDSVVVGGGASLPSLTSNAGKWLTNNGSIALWVYPGVSAISDYASDQTNRHAATLASAQGFAIAMAIAL